MGNSKPIDLARITMDEGKQDKVRTQIQQERIAIRKTKRCKSRGRMDKTKPKHPVNPNP